MSKSSHARHEQKEHARHSHESEITEPDFNTRHKKLIWIVIILFAIGGTIFFAVASILRALF